MSSQLEKFPYCPECGDRDIEAVEKIIRHHNDVLGFNKQGHLESNEKWDIRQELSFHCEACGYSVQDKEDLILIEEERGSVDPEQHIDGTDADD